MTNKSVAVIGFIKIRRQLTFVDLPDSVRTPPLGLSVVGAQAAIFHTETHTR